MILPRNQGFFLDEKSSIFSIKYQISRCKAAENEAETLVANTALFVFSTGSKYWPSEIHVVVQKKAVS